jgi:hypothetical protein
MKGRQTKGPGVLQVVIWACLLLLAILMATAYGMIVWLAPILALVAVIIVWDKLIGRETESRKAHILAIITGVFLASAVLIWSLTFRDPHIYGDGFRGVFQPGIFPSAVALMIAYAFTRWEITKTLRLYGYVSLGVILTGVAFTLLLATYTPT